MSQTSPPTTDYNPQDDEIDLFELFETLWTHKVFIGLVTLVFALAGLAYATFKPKTYTAKAVLEVGSYFSNGLILSVEPGENLAQVISQIEVISQTEGVKANLLRGSDRLVELEATNLQPEAAIQSLVEAVDFIVKRHQEVEQRIGQVRLIRSTAMVGAIKEQKSDETTTILVISTLLGLILAFMTILFRKSYLQFKLRAEARLEKTAS